MDKTVKIDSHQHFWHYSAQEYGWIDDSMAVLKRNFLPPDLATIFSANGFAGSVAVQARQSLVETQWLLDLADEHPLVKGVVGWIDLRSDRLDEQLQRLNTAAKLVGLRHVVQDEPDDQFLSGAAFCRGISRLRDYNLAYDILIYPRQLPAAIEFVRSFPEQRFVLDHIAKPLIKAGIRAPWEGQIRELASFPHVFCKVSGMVTEADWQNWTPENFTPFLDTVFAAFGMDRVMFGSDWPVCTVAASYEKVIGIVDSFLHKNNSSEKEQAAFWGGNAVRFYRLKI